MRYVLAHLPSGEVLVPNLHMEEVTVTEALSAPGRLTGTIVGDLRSLRAPDGGTLVRPWGAAIYALHPSGRIYGGPITSQPPTSGPLEVECSGFTSYLRGTPWQGGFETMVDVDVLDVVRHLWEHALGQEGSFPDVTLDSTMSGVRIGRELDEDSEYSPLGDTGPVTFAPWRIFDMQESIDAYLEQEWFDYRERMEVSPDGRRMLHHLDFQAPPGGTRRQDLRFKYGENVVDPPEVELFEDEYASHVQVWGAGEGYDKLRTPLVGGSTGRARRVAVIVDDSLGTQGEVDRRANDELTRRSRNYAVTQLKVRHHPNAPVGTFGVGDIVRVHADLDWTTINQDVRILEVSFDPANEQQVALGVEAVSDG